MVVEYWYAAPYLDLVPRVPRVLFAHDIDYAARRRAEGFRRDRSRGGGFGILEEAREKRALARAPFLWFLTEADRTEAVTECRVGGERTEVVPYGIDLERELRTRDGGDPPEDPRGVLFFGSFAADFNRDALAYTLDEVWPAVRARKPRARLVVAGGGLSPGLARRCRESGVEVRGEVRDVRALLLSTAVVLVPLRYGGGLRIRLLESLALERTVVGTPTGVLGMGPRAEREVLAGEDAGELAAQVVRALDDPGLRRDLGAAGRRWVSAHHAVERAAERQREILLQSRRLQSESP